MYQAVVASAVTGPFDVAHIVDCYSAVPWVVAAQIFVDQMIVVVDPYFVVAVGIGLASVACCAVVDSSVVVEEYSVATKTN